MFSYLREALTGKSGTQYSESSADSSVENKGQPDSQRTANSTNAMNGSGKRKGIVPKMFVGKSKATGIEEELRDLTTKYPYSRPAFLELVSREEIQIILLHSERLITLPKRNCLPGNTGYSECTNAGKSVHNEDQASSVELKLGITDQDYRNNDLDQLDLLRMFAVFDGHAGADVAVTVSHELPHRVKERLSDVIIDLKHSFQNNVEEVTTPQTLGTLSPAAPKRRLTVDRLVTGALEAAFHDMDENLIEDGLKYSVKGGCATILALFYAGKLYVANAGDCRAVMVLSGEPVPMSTDFTPESERRRLQQIAEQHPDLLGNEFCSTQFVQRVTRKDVGSTMLYRDSQMEGWANREIREEDLRFPLIIGEGKRARLLATIGLTRGLGDHNLKVFDSSIKIKPFLSSAPEVRIRDLRNDNLTADDVLILGSDGLWDVMTNQQATEIVNQVFSNLPSTDNTRYIAAAQCLVSEARGLPRSDRRDIWLLKGTTSYASHDDITCMVIPLLYNTVLNKKEEGDALSHISHSKLDTTNHAQPDRDCEPAESTIHLTADLTRDSKLAEPTGQLTVDLTGDSKLAEPTGQLTVDLTGDSKPAEPTRQLTVDLTGDSKPAEPTGQLTVDLTGDSKPTEPTGQLTADFTGDSKPAEPTGQLTADLTGDSKPPAANSEQPAKNSNPLAGDCKPPVESSTPLAEISTQPPTGDGERPSADDAHTLADELLADDSRPVSTVILSSSTAEQQPRAGQTNNESETDFQTTLIEAAMASTCNEHSESVYSKENTQGFSPHVEADVAGDTVQEPVIDFDDLVSGTPASDGQPNTTKDSSGEPEPELLSTVTMENLEESREQIAETVTDSDEKQHTEKQSSALEWVPVSEEENFVDVPSGNTANAKLDSGELPAHVDDQQPVGPADVS